MQTETPTNLITKTKGMFVIIFQLNSLQPSCSNYKYNSVIILNCYFTCQSGQIPQFREFISKSVSEALWELER